MGEALALDAAWLFSAFLILLIVAAAGIAARRFLLERAGATVECGLRQRDRSWRLGLASYQLDEFCWYRIFGVSMRPVRSSSVRTTREPRFFTSSTRPAIVTVRPPLKRPP